MGKDPKYLLIVLKERNGEYEYYHKSVHEIYSEKNTTPRNFAINYIKGFYGGDAKKGDGGYYFYGGEIHVEIYSYQKISKEEYSVLSRYL